MRESSREAIKEKCLDVRVNVMQTRWSEWKETKKQTVNSILRYQRVHKEGWINSSTRILIHENKRLKIPM